MERVSYEGETRRHSHNISNKNTLMQIPPLKKPNTLLYHPRETLTVSILFVRDCNNFRENCNSSSIVISKQSKKIYQVRGNFSRFNITFMSVLIMLILYMIYH